MRLGRRIELMTRLGRYLVSEDEDLLRVKERAFYENGWFIPEFVDYQLNHISTAFLQAPVLENWVSQYPLAVHEISRQETAAQEGAGAEAAVSEKTVGIVMAGNIPLAGFHDFLCAFISGTRQIIKPSSKDAVLIRAIVEKLREWEPETARLITISDQLRGCNGYIATGSNNSSRYFEYYFGKYPHIIRKNRSSVAVLTGDETPAELASLADDIYLYFGLGCRNVTKLFVPANYDFVPLLGAFRKYDRLADNHKYKNNYDYQLAIMIINKLFYMTNGSVLLSENPSIFSPISQVHYEYYNDPASVTRQLNGNEAIQCVVGKEYIAFGNAQHPAINDYADHADTLEFLLKM